MIEAAASILIRICGSDWQLQLFWLDMAVHSTSRCHCEVKQCVAFAAVLIIGCGSDWLLQLRLSFRIGVSDESFLLAFVLLLFAFMMHAKKMQVSFSFPAENGFPWQGEHK